MTWYALCCIGESYNFVNLLGKAVQLLRAGVDHVCFEYFLVYANRFISKESRFS